MNTEEIKALLELFSQLGAEAKEGFVWWLLADKVLPILLGGFGICAAAWVIHRIVQVCAGSREERDAREVATAVAIHLRDAAGIGSPGSLDPHEAREVVRFYERLLIEDRARKEAAKDPGSGRAGNQSGSFRP